MTFYTILFWLVALIISLAMGSFITMLAFRLPKQLLKNWQDEAKSFLTEYPESIVAPFNIAFPGSFCLHCKHPIAWYDNVPLLGFIWQKGRCRHCHEKIAKRYPFIELICLISSLSVVTVFGMHSTTLAGLLLTWGLLALSVIDLDYQFIPDPLSLGLLWLGLLVNVFGVFTPLSQAVLGAIVAYLALWIIMKLYALITQKIGMGHGDFKLYAALGAWLGLHALLPIILIAAVLGSIVGLTLLATKRINASHPIPFGPFLALAGWLVLLLPKLPWGFSIG